MDSPVPLLGLKLPVADELDTRTWTVHWPEEARKEKAGQAAAVVELRLARGLGGPLQRRSLEEPATRRQQLRRKGTMAAARFNTL